MKGATVTEDIVKQDLERATELQRSALRVISAFNKVGAGVSPKLGVFVEEIRKSQMWGTEFKEFTA
jgi:cullin-associated NEDD8-dissociated protein 1